MKKNFVKAMSVGLSAITVAGSLNMTAMANEITGEESSIAVSEDVSVSGDVVEDTTEETNIESSTVVEEEHKDAASILSDAQAELEILLSKYGVSEDKSYENEDIEKSLEAAKAAYSKALEAYAASENALSNANADLESANNELADTVTANDDAKNHLEDAIAAKNTADDANTIAQSDYKAARTEAAKAQFNANKTELAVKGATAGKELLQQIIDTQTEIKEAAEIALEQAEADLSQAHADKRAAELKLNEIEKDYRDAIVAYGVNSLEVKSLEKNIVALNIEIVKQQGIIDKANATITKATSDKQSAENELESANISKQAADAEVFDSNNALNLARSNEAIKKTESEQANQNLINLNQQIENATLAKNSADQALVDAVDDFTAAQSEYAAAEKLEDLIVTVEKNVSKSRTLNNNTEIAKSLIKFYVYECNKEIDPARILFVEDINNIHWEDNSITAYYLDENGDIESRIGIYNFETKTASDDHVSMFYEYLTDHIVIVEKETATGTTGFLGFDYHAPKSKVILDERDFLAGKTDYHTATGTARKNYNLALADKLAKDADLALKTSELDNYINQVESVELAATEAAARYEEAKADTNLALNRVNAAEIEQNKAEKAVTTAQNKINSAAKTIKDNTTKKNNANVAKTKAQQDLEAAIVARGEAKQAVVDATNKYNKAVKDFGEESKIVKNLEKTIISLNREVGRQELIIVGSNAAIAEATKVLAFVEEELAKATEASAKAASELSEAKTKLEEAQANKEKAEDDLAIAKANLEEAQAQKSDCEEALSKAKANALSKKNAFNGVAFAHTGNMSKLEELKNTYNILLQRFEATKAAIALKKANAEMAKNAANIIYSTNTEPVSYNEVAYDTVDGLVLTADFAEVEDTTVVEALSNAKVSGTMTSATRKAAASTNTESVITIEDEATPLAGENTSLVANENNESAIVESTKKDDKTSNLFAKSWGWLLLLLAAITGGTYVYKKRKSTK